MTAKSNPLANTVLAILMQTPEKCMRRRDIQDDVSKNYRNKYAENSFNVILSRTLNQLMKQGLLKKSDRGHMQVYYYIPKRRQKKIAEKLERQAAHKQFDEFWDTLTPEQRKHFGRHTQKLLDAAFNVLFQRIVTDALKEGREYVTLTEFNQPLKDVVRELNRPKVGNLFKPQTPYKNREERLRKQRRNRTKT